MPTRLFRKPNVTVRHSPTFGLPIGTFGRPDYPTPRGIVLHILRTSLEVYDAQETNPFIRNKAEPRHPSLHYAIDYAGNVHQYVEDADIAWGLWDYKMDNFPISFAFGNWALFAEIDRYNISPDYYCLHIGAVSGERTHQSKLSVIFTPAMLLAHARLIAWLCHTYSIACDTDHITTHEHVDTQFELQCATSEYPFDLIMSMAQQIIADGGEYDVVFEQDPTLPEFLGRCSGFFPRIKRGIYF